MSETTSTVPLGVSDKELFEGATAPEPERATEPEATPEQTGEQPRDEHGRFAPKDAAEAKPETAAEAVTTEQPQPGQTEDDKDGQVPSWRLRELREARDAAQAKAEETAREGYALRQQLQQMQNELANLRKPKEEPVNFFDNPDAAMQQRLTPVEERFAQLQQEMRLTTSRAMAIAVHGAKTVQEMEQAIGKAMRENHPEMPTLAMQMRNASDPTEVAMQWHMRTKLLAETGGDLTSYKQKLRDELMKDPEFQKQVIESARGSAQQGGRPSPVVQLPPSLSRTPGSGANSTEDTGDMNDAALFRDAVNYRRKK